MPSGPAPLYGVLLLERLYDLVHVQPRGGHARPAHKMTPEEDSSPSPTLGWGRDAARHAALTPRSSELRSKPGPPRRPQNCAGGRSLARPRAVYVAPAASLGSTHEGTIASIDEPADRSAGHCCVPAPTRRGRGGGEPEARGVITLSPAEGRRHPLANPSRRQVLQHLAEHHIFLVIGSFSARAASRGAAGARGG